MSVDAIWDDATSAESIVLKRRVAKVLENCNDDEMRGKKIGKGAF